ncbi:hypothetical protein NKJ88_01430 [Mesorhizobium sp. M0016]|uniref:hypothetical protein n=1 Tax=Mesorhizobium sp. M0016 TaxID=2956843 RepID=UPI00333859A4
MLSQKKIDRLAETVLGVLGPHPNFRNFVNTVRPGFWDEIVPVDAPPKVAATEVLRIAGERGWLADFLKPLVERFPSRGESRMLVQSLNFQIFLQLTPLFPTVVTPLGVENFAYRSA